MPQVVNPSSQTYQSSVLSGAEPGASQNVTDGQDLVTAASIQTTIQNQVNTDAYLAALVLGPNAAPPNAQPPTIASAGPGSGIVRIRTLPPGVNPALIAGTTGSTGDMYSVPGVGLYTLTNTAGIPEWVTGSHFSFSNLAYYGTQIWACTSVSGNAGSSAPDAGIWNWSEPWNDGTLHWVSVTPAATDNFYAIAVLAGTWGSTTQYAINTYLLDSGNYWQATVPGTSGASNPLPASPPIGQTVTDGSGPTQITWTCVPFVGQWNYSGNLNVTETAAGQGIGTAGLLVQLNSNAKIDPTFIPGAAASGNGLVARIYGSAAFNAGTTPTWAGSQNWTQNAVSYIGQAVMTITTSIAVPANYLVTATVSISGASSDVSAVTVADKSSSGNISFTLNTAVTSGNPTGSVDFCIYY